MRQRRCTTSVSAGCRQFARLTGTTKRLDRSNGRRLADSLGHVPKRRNWRRWDCGLHVVGRDAPTWNNRSVLKRSPFHRRRHYAAFLGNWASGGERSARIPFPARKSRMSRFPRRSTRRHGQGRALDRHPRERSRRGADHDLGEASRRVVRRGFLGCFSVLHHPRFIHPHVFLFVERRAHKDELLLFVKKKQRHQLGIAVGDRILLVVL